MTDLKADLNNVDMLHRIFDPRDVPPNSNWHVEMPVDVAMASVIEKISDKMSDLKMRLKELEKVEEENDSLKKEVETLRSQNIKFMDIYKFLAKNIERDNLSMSWVISDFSIKANKEYGDLILKTLRDNDSGAGQFYNRQ